MTLRCRIIAEGHADERFVAIVGDLAITEESHGEWRIDGQVPDHAALDGVLANLQDLGLGLVSVETTEQNR